MHVLYVHLSSENHALQSSAKLIHGMTGHDQGRSDNSKCGLVTVLSLQVGCLVHELLCGCLPFESDDKLLASALILWADVTVFPDNLSPQCVAFIQVSYVCMCLCVRTA